MMKTTSTDRYLASAWSPSDKLPTQKSAGKPILCVGTTYTFHADFLERDLLPRFLGMTFDDAEGERPFLVEREEALSSCRVVVLVDASQADSRQSTLRWDQVPVFVPGGLQHAKVTLLVWESCIRVIVASANLTSSGYRKNREIAGVLDFFNHEDSTPRRIAYDVIEFLQAMTYWARADTAVLERARASLQGARARLGRWSIAPTDFTERERPRVYFLAGYPRREGGAASSVLNKAITTWGSGTVKEISVVTPFLGQPDSDYRKLIDALRTFPLARDAVGYLVLPRRQDIDSDDKTPRIGLPKRFLHDWASAWNIRPDEVNVFAVPSLRKETNEKLLRDFHAKAILIGNDTNTMLLCGSSNFSAQGMGLGRYNIEANLTYLDSTQNPFGKVCLEDCLPVDWIRDRVEAAVWDEEGATYGEDEEPREPQLPKVFQWATFRQKEAIVTIGFLTGEALPLRWEIQVPGDRNETGLTILVPSDQWTSLPERVEVLLPEHLRKAHLTNLRVVWFDENNSERTARLLVHVLCYEDLIPPAECLGMSVSGIVDCLISGKRISEIAQEEESEGFAVPTGEPVTGTQRVATKDYLLYRMRRLGYALGMLGERILKAARSEDSLSYRLLHDPLGPNQLTDALIREFKDRPYLVTEREALVFALHEIALVVAHAGARCHAKREAGEPDFRTIFKACIVGIAEKSTSVVAEGKVDQALLKYGRKVLNQANQLIG